MGSQGTLPVRQTRQPGTAAQRHVYLGGGKATRPATGAVRCWLSAPEALAVA